MQFILYLEKVNQYKSKMRISYYLQLMLFLQIKNNKLMLLLL